MNSICGIVSCQSDLLLRDGISAMLPGVLTPSCRAKIYSEDYFAIGTCSADYTDAVSIETGSHVFAAVGRVYNHKEAFLCLNDRGFTESNYLGLLAQTYIEHGLGGLTVVEGEWLFFAWDKQNKSLCVVSSHYQIPNLYYYCSGDSVYFASTTKALLALSCVPKKLNEYRLAQYLLRWNDTQGETVYEGIESMSPGSRMYVHEGNMRFERYYAMEASEPIRYQNTEDYVERFRELYTTSVVQRMDAARGKVVSSLSGGLDSGSVSSLAARELGRTNNVLETYSSVPWHDVSGLNLRSRFLDETEYVAETAAFSGNIHVNYIKSEKTGLLDGIRSSIDVLSEPLVAASNHYWIHDMIQAALWDKSETLLIGQNGNNIVSWSGIPMFLSELPFLFQRIRAVDVAFCKSLLKLALKKVIVSKPSFLKQKNPSESFDIFDFKQNSVINQSFAEKTGIQEDYFRSKSKLINERPRKRRVGALKPSYSSCSYLWHEFGRYYDLWITDPTADRRLIEFCLNIPNSQYCACGETKLLIKRGMKGIMSDKVLYNERRGQQAADIQARFMNEMNEVNALISKMKSSGICKHYMDLKNLEDSVEIVNRSKENGFNTFSLITTKIMNGLSTGMFLLDFEKKY